MIEALKAVALEAGEVVKEGFYSTKEVIHKGTVDLVTLYDKRTEEVATKLLEAAFPDFTVIGEEFGEGKAATKAIYVDPIDGTTNFVHGLPHVSLSMGIYDGDDALAAVVYNPILNELFWAEKGKGAWLGDERLRVSKTVTLQNALVATGFPYAKVERGPELAWVLERMGRVLPATRDLRRYGAASLDLCYLAQGKFDGYYEINLKPWDIAAGLLILAEAGGIATDEQGRTSTLFDTILVTSNGRLHEPLLKLIA